MEILHHCCAGLDVHKKSVVACIRRLGPDGRAEELVRTFGTMTGDLLELADWLAAHAVVHVAMESTGVYWKPVFHLLEDRFQLLLVNAQHIKQVPGRKTDVKDRQWIAQLGNIGCSAPASFRPSRSASVRPDAAAAASWSVNAPSVSNRIQKVLEDANIKLSSVASEVLGVSGRAMITAGRAARPKAGPSGRPGTCNVASVARSYAQAPAGVARATSPTIIASSSRTLMDHVGHLEDLIGRLDQRIEEAMSPFAKAVERLVTIPGVNQRAAEVIVAEIGTDMTKFPSAGHLSSWAGMCSGNHQSAGKRQSGRTTKGDRWLRQVLVQVAWAASHTKATFLAATYHRWVKRMGKKRALVALGHKILVLIYELLKDQTRYQERLVPDQAA